MDEAHTQLVRRWLHKAANDLKNARIVAPLPDGPLDTAIYHCQQAAEKAIKAYLLSQHAPFEKTHDVVRLVRQAEVIEPSFGKFIESARILTPMAWQFRYPSETQDDEPDRHEVDDAIERAQAFYEFVLNLLPGEAHP